MRRKLLNYIQCPICGGSFRIIVIEESSVEIEKGMLVCDECGFVSEFYEGIVNLLYQIDADTLKEIFLHIQDGKEMFEKELLNSSLEHVRKSWAYLEQDSSKEYGKNVKKIFFNAMQSVAINKTDIILDLGMGTGWSTAQLAKMGGYCIGIDLCKPIKLDLSTEFFIKEQVFFERCMANMMRLPIQDQCIDKVISMASLHHASDLPKTLKEIHRVLKPGGELILIGEPVVPREYFGIEEEFVQAKAKGFNEHQYTAEDWFNFIENAGFHAKDGTQCSDDLNKYYQVDCNNLQNPLPVFVKTNSQMDNILTIALLSQEFAENCNGGICRYTYDLAHGLASRGHHIHILCKSDKPYDYSYLEGDVMVHKINPHIDDFPALNSSLNISNKNISYSYAACVKLLELHKKHKIQIVEAPLWDAEGFAFSLLKPVPLVIRIETPLFKVVEIQDWEITPDIRISNWLEGETVRNADIVISISSAIGDLIANHHHISREKMVISPLGIRIPPRELLQPNDKKKVFEILFVGRLEKRKGIETLFKAIPQIIEKIPSVQFIIIGKDSYLSPENASYKDYLLKHLNFKYHNQVNFIGFVEEKELNEYYKRCNVFVAPSLYESFGLIYLEAMAWGKPVIGCSSGGIPEIVHDGVNGFLINPDDYSALSQKIIDLYDDKLRQEMGQKGRELVEARFSLSQCVGSTLKIYQTVCADFQQKED